MLPTARLQSAAEPIVRDIFPSMKPAVGAVTADDELMPDAALSAERKLSPAYRRAADSADGVRVQLQDDFVVVLSASVTLDCDGVWGQTAGRASLVLPFLSASGGNCMMPKAISFQLCCLNSLSLPESSLLGSNAYPPVSLM